MVSVGITDWFSASEKVRGGLVIFKHNDRLPVAVHAGLCDGDVGCLARGEQDIVVGGVLGLGEFFRS